MGPPREHGGMNSAGVGAHAEGSLQWGRRVNTAECQTVRRCARRYASASMGPPREHGGMAMQAQVAQLTERALQWGRRVNTAECRHSHVACTSYCNRFNGAAA